MKRLLKVLFGTIGALVLIIVVALAYLNFLYLPQQVKSKGPAYLEEKSKGQLKAESMQYVPFKGVRLKNIALISKTQKPILSIDKLYFSVNLWPLIIRKDLDFRLELYPPQIRQPIIFSGLYRINQRTLDMDFKAKTDLFIPAQTITGKLTASPDPEEEKLNLNLDLNSRDLNVQGEFHIKDKDLRIEKLTGEVLDSAFEFIGELQSDSSPTLNIYGNLDLNLAGLKNINPKYCAILSKLEMDGRCPCEIYMASQVNNPEVGLKVSASQIKVDKIKIDSLTIVSKLENKELSLKKCYAKLYGGEFNLQGDCNLAARDFPVNLDLNMFNLELNRLIGDVTEKDTPIHGRIFSLSKLKGYLKDPQSAEGKLWISAAGSNILQLPLFSEIADILRLPELRKTEFKEAGGNFLVAQGALRTDDFKITSDSVVIYFKGYVDLNGDLAFDVLPSFSEAFLVGAPNIKNILGVFIDSTGNFLGEIKMKGSIKQPRLTYKPVSIDKLLHKGIIEEGIKQLFKLKKKEDQNQ